MCGNGAELKFRNEETLLTINPFLVAQSCVAVAGETCKAFILLPEKGDISPPIISTSSQALSGKVQTPSSIALGVCVNSIDWSTISDE